MVRPIARIASVVLTVLIVGVLVGPATAQVAAAEPIPYVVHARSLEEASAAARAVGAHPVIEFSRAITGFTAWLRPSQAERLRTRPGVLNVEADRRMAPLPTRPTPNRVPLPATRVETNWGIDRIDQVALPLDHSFRVRATGAGVTIYVFDTGVDVTHPEFGGRARVAFDALDGQGPLGALTTGGEEGAVVDEDCASHGTAVAGIAASATHGVAKEARIESVRVLDCAGTANLTSLLAGIEWVAHHARRPAVAVMSWSYGPSEILRSAVAELVRLGVFVATSAGNSGGDECGLAPRSADGVLVVANSTRDDRRAASSGTGGCVDLYAPGTAVVSVRSGGGSAVFTGTSIAAPHAAGVAALYKQVHGDAPSHVIEDWIVRTAVPDVVQGGGEGGTPNRLLYTGGL